MEAVYICDGEKVDLDIPAHIFGYCCLRQPETAASKGLQLRILMSCFVEFIA